MQTNQSEQENSQNFTGIGANMKYPLVDFTPIEDTVFSIVNDPNHGYFLAIGQNRISEYYKTHEEAMYVLEHPTEKWNVIMKMIIIVHEAAERTAEEERKTAMENFR